MPDDKKHKLDIGPSYYKAKDFIGLDILRSDGVDVVGDARCMPLKTSSIDEIYSSYCLEHIDDQLAVVKEVFRVCKPGAMIRLILPHFSNPAFFDDLTHQRLYSTRSFEHYDHDMHALTGYPNYLPEVNIKLISAELRWWPPQIIARKGVGKRLILNTLNGIVNWLANAHPFLCERVWCRWIGGFYEVDYVMKVVK